MDMNQHYLELKIFLCEVQTNADCVLDPTHRVFKSEKRLYTDLKTNHRLRPCMVTITYCLFTVPENEVTALRETVIAGARGMLDKLCSYARNQLPGGIFWEPEQSIKDVLRQLKPTNDVAESVLGLNDYLTTAIPNLHQTARSSLIQVKKNKTVKWLNALPEERQTSVIELAVKNRTHVAEKCKRRTREV